MNKRKNRKSKSKRVKSTKKNAWDDGYRYGFNRYDPSGIGHGDIMLDFEFNEGYCIGLRSQLGLVT